MGKRNRVERGRFSDGVQRHLHEGVVATQGNLAEGAGKSLSREPRRRRKL